MIKLILVPGLLCTKRLFETQISALKYDYEIEVANTLGVNTIHEMAQEIIQTKFEFCDLWLINGWICCSDGCTFCT